MLLQCAVGIPAVSVRMPADSLPHLGGPAAPGPAPGWHLVGLTARAAPGQAAFAPTHVCAQRSRLQEKNGKPHKYKARPGEGENANKSRKLAGQEELTCRGSPRLHSAGSHHACPSGTAPPGRGSALWLSLAQQWHRSLLLCSNGRVLESKHGMRGKI